MNEFLDIIILALITFFLALKLFGAFGQKNNKEQELDTNSQPVNKAKIKNVEVNLKNLTSEQKLQLLDPSFNNNSFLNNAKSAFKMILEAYATGDNLVLSKLLDVSMMRKFMYEISKREEKDIKCEINVLKIPRAHMQDVSLDGSIATILVEIEAEIINYCYDASNKEVVSGNKSKVEKDKHVWGFSRNLNSQDPNWMLVSVNKLFS